MVEIDAIATAWVFRNESAYSTGATNGEIVALGCEDGFLHICDTVTAPQVDKIVSIDTKCDQIFFLEIVPAQAGFVIVGADQSQVFAVRDNEVNESLTPQSRYR